MNYRALFATIVIIFSISILPLYIGRLINEDSEDYFIIWGFGILFCVLGYILYNFLK